MGSFDLESYLTGGVEQVMKEIIRATLTNPRESAFMAGFAMSTKKAAKIRAESAKAGTHVPPFLICSITSQCNLHCAGCYARAESACSDDGGDGAMSAEDWGRVFDQAAEMGVSFIMLAGGEPLMRRDVLEEAAKRKNIFFPVFTNGTMVDSAYAELFDKNRNLFPVFSIEGDQGATDTRRGAGVYEMLKRRMELLSGRGVLFGASVTVTSRNLDETARDSFVEQLSGQGCRGIFYVEYVPADGNSEELALNDEERERLADRVALMRERYPGVVFISFPGDEKSSGGCLAAGRGFFHINANGGAEPCPFSPFSDVNVKETSVREALSSQLFKALQEGGALLEEHTGGCVLYEKRDLVSALLSR